MALLTDSWKVDILAIFIGALTIIYFHIKRQYSYWDRKGFKTLPGYNYLVGHFRESFLGKKSFADFSTALYRSTNEPFIGIYGVMRPQLMIRDPELLRSILIKDFSYFTDRGLYSNEEHDTLSAGLFTLRGEKWTNLRRKLSPSFTSSKVKAMFQTLLDCGSTLQSHLEKLVDNDELLDIWEVGCNYATNFIASVGFGIDIDTINNPNNEFRVCGRKIFEPTFWKSIKFLIVFIAPRLMDILRLNIFDSEVESFIRSVVKQNLEHREKNNVVRKDFFQLLIQLRNTGTVRFDNQWETVIEEDEKQKTLTLNDMVAQTFNFFAAGFERSSATLSYCLYELAKNQDIQKRVHEEIDEVLAQHNGKITYDSMNLMKYLEQCIDEALRKYPPVPFLTRECVKDYTIPGTNKTIEKGVQMFIPVFALHRMPQYFPDPDKFDPERFSEENSAGKSIVYLAFGNGNRNCIGMRMGKVQVKVGLVLMLQKFRFELEDRLRQHELKFDSNLFLLAPVERINLQIKKR